MPSRIGFVPSHSEDEHPEPIAIDIDDGVITCGGKDIQK
jgi:hypothetical protein